MNKKEAIDILIGLAVCISPELCCADDCPFYIGKKHCKYVKEKRDFELKEAVKVLEDK